MAETLAIDGGRPVRRAPMPARRLFGFREAAAALRVFGRSMRTGEAFGYNGPDELAYEKAFVSFMGGGFADGVNSGTNALFCALGALRIEPFSEIVVPPITDPGGVMPVVFCGCVPVVADAAPSRYNVCADTIRPLVSERTKAIVVAHIGGEPVDMDPIMELAAERGLFVVEDCAQSHGARYKGKLVGTVGHLAAFSTMSGKHHATGAQGGVVYTTDEELHLRARRFADRGKPFGLQETTNVTAGLNCNLNDLSAAIGRVQISRLAETVRRRRLVGRMIEEGLRGCSAAVPGVDVPGGEGVYWFLRCRLDLARLSVPKERFCAALAAEGIPVTPSYRHIPAEAAWFRERNGLGASGYPWTAAGYGGDREPRFPLPNAVRAAEEHFNIPVHERYGEREAADIAAAVRKVERAFLLPA